MFSFIEHKATGTYAFLCVMINMSLYYRKVELLSILFLFYLQDLSQYFLHSRCLIICSAEIFRESRHKFLF